MPNAGLQLSWCMYVSAICAVLHMYIVQSTVCLLHASTYALAPRFTLSSTGLFLLSMTVQVGHANLTDSMMEPIAHHTL